MKQLTCEMCGSTDLMKQDGVFVCQTCGCKYSVEEAKKMMIEGTVEVTGTVRVDDSSAKMEQIKNYLEMAKAALDDKNIIRVNSYCDRILEIDRNNYEVWILRAKTAGWRSSLHNNYGDHEPWIVQDAAEWESTIHKNKMSRALTAAKRAVDLTPDSKKYEVASEVYHAIKTQIVGLLNEATCERYHKYILPVMLQWQSVLVEIPFLSKSLMENEIKECRLLCEESKRKWDGRYIYASYSVDNHKISYDKMFENALADKIKKEEEKAKAEADARKASYWNAHSVEKNDLESEKTELTERVDNLTKQLEALQENSMVEQLKNQIATLKKEKDALGLFKGKEKRALQEQIDSLNGRLTTANAAKYNAVAPFQVEINELNKRIREIDAELTKDR